MVFQTGQRDSANFIAPGTFMLKAEPVDENGNLIDKHNLWEMVGVRYRRSLFPGFSDQESFTFMCPGAAVPVVATPARGAAPDPAAKLDRSVAMRVPRNVTTLRVTAKLMYRKADQYLLNFLFGATSGITARVTVMSEAHKVIRVAGN
jgi:hypothetical protein